MPDVTREAPGAARPAGGVVEASTGSAIRFTDPGLIRERIADALREAIVAGRLRPGERLRERDLVGTLGISRSPLREAIRVLEAEGLVTTAPHRGAWVTELTAEDLRETTEVRVMLEMFAARLTCEKGDPSTLQRLEDHVARARSHETTRGVVAEVEESMAFHDGFVLACGNSRVIQFYDVTKRLMRRYQLFAFSRLGRAARARDEHASILEAFRARDAHATARLLEQHIREASEEIARHLPVSRSG